MIKIYYRRERLVIIMTRTEKRILNIMNKLRILSIIISAFGFGIMIYCSCQFEQDIITFKAACFRLIIGCILLFAGIFCKRYVTDVHDSFCEQLGIPEKIIHNRFLYDYDNDIDDETVLQERIHQKELERKEQEKQQMWANYFQNYDFFNINKIQNESEQKRIPDGTIQFTPITHGRPVKQSRIASEK